MDILVKMGKSDLSYTIAVILFIPTEVKNERKYKSTFRFKRKCRISNIQEISSISWGKKNHTYTHTHKPKRQCEDLTPGGAVG